MILTIDQGTTSSRALIINADGKVLGISQKEFKQIYPRPGWVEHEPNEIWETTLEVCEDVISKVPAKDIKGIAITNQRETTILWDKRTGDPVYNAIVWQCRRTADYCKELRSDKKFSEQVRNKTGLLIDSYFSGPKLSWLLNKDVREEQVLAQRDNCNSGVSSLEKKINDYGMENLLFGTIDAWLLWKLTKGESHYTEPSNASRTMLYDIHKDCWDPDILKKLEIPESILPEVIASDSNFGTCSLFNDLGAKDLEIKAILGDQQAAWYAHKEAAKITYGTGSFILVPNLTAQNTDGLVTSVGYGKENGEELKTRFVLEGSIFIAGAIVQWLRDELQIIKKSSEIEELAKTVDDNGGVYLIPGLVGLGAPHWREDVKGAIFGITRGTNRGHIARAALEGIAYSVKDVFEKLSDKPKFINVDGGATKNDTLMQFQANLLGIEIHRFENAEMTALGAARMTGEVDYDMKPEKIFKPENDLSKNYSEWKSYMKKLLA